MNITKRRGAAMAGVLALALVAAACGSDNSSSSSTTASGGAATTAGGGAATTGSGGATTTVKVSGTIQGSGSTLQKPYQDEATVSFTKAHSGTTVTYGGGGSGKGRTDLASKVVNFAGSDSTFGASDKPADPILYFPILFSPITVSYNVKGVSKLQLSADTIAKIFSLQVTKWNDPAIAADNPGTTLPATNITVAHRSDGSGTTQNFTEYLAKAAPATWKLGSGSTVPWPAGSQAGNGNAGVAQIITSTDGGVGYVDLSDAVAAKLVFASVKNSSGNYIVPSTQSATAAADGITVSPDLTFSSTNTSAPQGYPITAPSWVIIYQSQDATAGPLVKAYISYLVGDGQKLLPDLDYASLSSSLQQQAVAQLAQIKIAGA